LGVAGIGLPIGCPLLSSCCTVKVQMQVETKAPLLFCSENLTGTVLPG
jgi:hypothetical protein